MFSYWKDSRGRMVHTIFGKAWTSFMGPTANVSTFDPEPRSSREELLSAAGGHVGSTKPGLPPVASICSERMLSMMDGVSRLASRGTDIKYTAFAGGPAQASAFALHHDAPRHLSHRRCSLPSRFQPCGGCKRNRPYLRAVRSADPLPHTRFLLHRAGQMA